MARVKRPEFARRLTTHMSEREATELERAAHDDSVTVAHILRNAAKDWLARRHEAAKRVRAVAVS